MSTPPENYEKPGNTPPVSHNTSGFFCFRDNTKRRRVFDPKLQQHNKPTNGQGMKKDAEERLPLSDNAHKCFCVISQETRPGCQNQVRQKKLKGVSFQNLQTRTLLINSCFRYVVYFSKTHGDRQYGACN